MPMVRLTMAAALAAGALMVGAPVLAQGSLADQLQVCARINNNSARLECYDSVAAAARQGGGSSSLGGMRQAPPPPAGAPSSTFGAEQLDRPAAPDEDRGADEIEIAVVSSRDNGLSMWSFTLSDGAVWRMTERAPNFRPPAPNETVRIRRGALGSYLIRVGQQPSVRIERVR